MKQHRSTPSNPDIIFGVNPVLEKLKASSADILEIFISEGSDRSPLRFIRQEAQRFGLRVQSIDGKNLDRLVGGHGHQGVAARVRPYRYLAIEELLQRISKANNQEWILILDGLTDPRNFGALLRTAEAVGVRYVVIPKDRSVEVTPTVVKASAGAAQYLKIAKVTNIRRAIAQLKEYGFWIVGLDPQSRESVYDRSFPSKLAIVLGSEGKGVRPVNLRECDFSVSIPMLGKVGSLNVGVAGAVFLYELLRQNRSVNNISSGTE
jgi:23S rRNA (guanosine2251-2'-O)-methyltransferase